MASPTHPGDPSTPMLGEALSRVPYAEEGDVIRPDGWNAIRDTLVALASAVASPPARKRVYIDVVPQFQKHDPLAPWDSALGYAYAKSASGAATKDATGWQAVALPEGMRIAGMSGLGQLTGAATMSLVLKRIETSDPDQQAYPVVEIDVTQSGNFETPLVPPSLPSGFPGTLAEYTEVEPSRFRYLVFAFATVPGNTYAQVNTIRIACDPL
ncbi:hypothetical protein [Streptomyces sp. NPDC059916]|uniref:hypothetical protein n=1 Tax=Streptomyces sp. NPDC059916 TaxID=3347001 RepID=UPI00367DAD9A